MLLKPGHPIVIRPKFMQPKLPGARFSQTGNRLEILASSQFKNLKFQTPSDPPDAEFESETGDNMRGQLLGQIWQNLQTAVFLKEFC